MKSTIFISYRRSDSDHAAHRLYDKLAATFGEENVFMDVTAIDYGVNFIKAIEDAVSQSDILVAVIGKEWSDVRNEKGERRLDDPDDFVRLEIASALKRDIRVIPFVLEGATIPSPDQLPDDLAPLTQRNAFKTSAASFATDIDRLVENIQPVLQGGSREIDRLREALLQAKTSDDLKSVHSQIDFYAKSNPKNFEAAKLANQAQVAVATTEPHAYQYDGPSKPGESPPRLSSFTSKIKFATIAFILGVAILVVWLVIKSNRDSLVEETPIEQVTQTEEQLEKIEPEILKTDDESKTIQQREKIEEDISKIKSQQEQSIDLEPDPPSRVQKPDKPENVIPTRPAESSDITNSNDATSSLRLVTLEPSEPITIKNVIETPGAMDRYTFEATAGQEVFFERIGSASELIFTLYDSLDKEVFERHHNNLTRKVSLQRGGTYTLTVGNSRAPETGAYAFRLWSQ